MSLLVDHHKATKSRPGEEEAEKYDGYVPAPDHGDLAGEMRAQIIGNTAHMPWPAVGPVPISERTEGLATLCFPHLFIGGDGDPTIRTGRTFEVSEQQAATHLLKFAMPDPLEPAAPWYPYQENVRLLFWFCDRIRRQRNLEQSRVFMRKNEDITDDCRGLDSDNGSQ